MLSAEDYPLPCEYQSAYQNADVVVLEVDISAFSSAENMIKTQKAITYPKEENLRAKLTEQTAERLSIYLSSIGMPGGQVTQMRPGGLLVMLSSIEMMRSGIVAKGVDEHFLRMAEEDKKELRYLENFDHQLQLIANMGQGNEDAFVQYTLEGMENFSAQFAQLIQAWRVGDMSALSKVSEIGVMKEQFPKVFSSLIVMRNNVWMSKIENMLNDKKIEYILVGALHMAEDVGLLAQLRDRGYQVVQLANCPAPN